MKYCPWCQDEPEASSGEEPQPFWHLEHIRERNETEGRYARDSYDGRLPPVVG